MTRTPLRIMVMAAALALAACTATKLVYNNLDWFINWQIGKLVEFDEPQKALFDQSFPQLWKWHRSTQLALYAKDLRELADASAQLLTRAQIEDFRGRFTGHALRLWQEAQPEAARLLHSLDDKQITAMLGKMAKWRDERAEEVADRSDEETREGAEDDMRDALKHWVGRLTPEQEQRIRAWSAVRRDDAALERAYRESWASAFAGLLAQRNDERFLEHLAAFFRDPAVTHRTEIVELRAHNTRAWMDLLVDLSPTLTPSQREHFQDEVREVAEDLEDLIRDRSRT